MENYQKIIVYTVGGTPEPIKKSIMENRPDCIFFLCSHKSKEIAEKIINFIYLNGYSPKCYIIETLDEQNFEITFESTENCISEVAQLDPEKSKTILDITGGTKVMSSALVLSGALRGFQKINYVGGDVRDKGGLGVVQTGSETFITTQNPLNKDGYFELMNIRTLYSKHEYYACREIADAASKNESIQNQELFHVLRRTMDYYHKKDLFLFKEAYDSLNNKLIENLSFPSQGIKDFIQKTLENREHTNELIKFVYKFNIFKNQIFDDYSNEKAFSHLKNDNNGWELLLGELFANSIRRYEQGKYDDALLRLYRFLEMKAQFHLILDHQIYPSRANPESIPKSLRDEFKNRYSFPYKSNKTSLKIPMESCYRLLAELGNPISEFYNNSNEKKIFQNIQSSRNDSILAHGFNPVKKETYEKLKDALENWGFVPKKVIVNPKLVIG